jgi:hypothetical protein
MKSKILYNAERNFVELCKDDYYYREIEDLYYIEEVKGGYEYYEEKI